MNSIKKQRYDFVDYAKAIGIIMMVTWHMNSEFPILGSLCVAIFIFTGGFFVKGKETSLREVIIRGLKQLIIPYFLLSIIVFPFCWISPYLHPELYYGVNSFVDIFTRALIGMFLMQDIVTPYSFMPCGPLWFLPALFWCRLFFSLWSKAIHQKYSIINCSFLIIAIFSLYYFKITLFSLSSAAVCIPIFICGFYFKNFIFIKIQRLDQPIIFLFCAIIFSLLFISQDNLVGFDGGSFQGNFIIGYLRCLMGIFLILLIAIILNKLPMNKLKKGISRIGSATIAILGLHLSFIYIFKTFYSLCGYDPSKIFLFIAIPVSLIISILITLIHHKILQSYLPASIGKGNLNFIDRTVERIIGRKKYITS